ncbi:uncharacterized protein Z518_02725 [Rhinocladiella mackenziei CBS 650.93]|uniref:BHLH domain-containing protein n=1 Tax=Rhinocladiella mackenziei CBS 650.93 TaxID=1442369 RepID=A0A0D2JFM2_9EURO|nr:uncharacterized protein Z518_02725 [Rhinocladiella mackenziei CBS 650.93]KIX08070.1 hypothetical protein Z518_02725 [Rhinocladiella mackenziei CBS 650.93]
MPFPTVYRQEEGSHDFHNQHGFQRHHPQIAIVNPDTVDYSGWHEMDFTTSLLNSPLTNSAPHHQKYASNMETGVDSLAYLRSSNHRQNSTGSTVNPSCQSRSHQQSPEANALSGDLYTTGPFSYSQLLNMDSDISPMDQSSLCSSRADGDSNMLNDDNTLPTSLSVSDSLNTSPPVSTLDPISISSKTDPSEKLCPLIAGQVDTCQPQRCGPDAPCMNFTTLPPIEECTSVPCITQSTNPNETMITSDSVSVSLHSRPSISARTSSGNTSSHSSPLRRSSGSSNDNPVQSVPLPPRRSAAAAAAAAAARRRTRTSTTTTSTNTIASDDEEEPATAKPIAPSKADAKQRAKQAHSLVERKYRENLNAKIAQLHNTLQSSHYGPKIGDDADSDAPAAANAIPTGKVRKSDVLTEAMNYVNQTEVEMRHMENEIHRLSERVRVLEKLVRCEDCSLLKQMVNLQVQAV